MKKACLIYKKEDAELNKFFIDELTRYLFENNISCQLVFYEDFSDCLINSYDIFINRSREEDIAIKAEDNGKVCFNNALVCKIGNDKLKCHEFMYSLNVPVMNTYIKDEYGNVIALGEDENTIKRSGLSFPCVIKTRNGHGGNEVYIANNESEMAEIENNLAKEGKAYIYQDVATDIGKDLRVYIIGGKPVVGMLRSSSHDFRSNFSLGGQAEVCELQEDVLAILGTITKNIQIDYAGIDFIYNNGNPVLNEIEDMVGARMLYSKTDMNPAKLYAEHILNHITNTK